MKAVKIITLALIGLIFAPVVSLAQTDKESIKSLKSNAIKDARKEAKTYEKQGYKVMPGKMALDKQLESAWIAQTKEESDGQATYFVASTTSKGGNYSAAKTMADNQAKLDIANQVGAKVGQIITNKMTNLDLGEGDRQSMTDMLASSKTVVAQSLGRTETVLEIYKDLEKGQVEVMLTVVYNVKNAVREAVKAMRTQMEGQSTKMSAELDSILKEL